MNKKTTFPSVLLIVMALLLAGCGVLSQTRGEDEALIIPAVGTESSEMIEIAQSGSEQSELELEVASLREQVSGLLDKVNEQEVALDSAETALNDAIGNIETTITAQVAEGQATDAQDPIIVETQPEVPIVQTSAGLDLTLQDSLTALYDNVNPSVVFIVISNQQGLGGSGSGFVYDTDGNIVTNNHVVSGATDIEVVFADGSRSDAELIGTDVDSDLAVIRAERLPDDALPIPLSSMSAVDVGQFAVAIGNPFGEQGSMSLGIISGLGRSLNSQRQIDGRGSSYSLPQVIQTDAPINPGNSGGPLLNLNGEVIGVNAAIRTTTGENSGVGFSIPVDAVRLIAPELIANGEYTYPYLGLSFALEARKQFILEQSGIDFTFGAYVGDVLDGGPADRGGVQGSDAAGFGGDLITALNGQEIKDFGDLNAFLVFNTQPGDTIEATVLRDGELVTLEITLGERP